MPPSSKIKLPPKTIYPPNKNKSFRSTDLPSKDFPKIFYPPQLEGVHAMIARAFNKSEATLAVALDISKAFDRV